MTGNREIVHEGEIPQDTQPRGGTGAFVAVLAMVPALWDDPARPSHHTQVLSPSHVASPYGE